MFIGSFGNTDQPALIVYDMICMVAGSPVGLYFLLASVSCLSGRDPKVYCLMSSLKGSST